MTHTSISPNAIASPGFDEETARADVYGLLAQLFYAPAAPELLAQLRAAAVQAPQAGGFLEGAWRELVLSASTLSDDTVAGEYDALFGGIGRPEVYLFGSHYLTGFLNEKPVVALRNDLARLGLARDEAMPETEDHIAYLCEVMRYLIAGDDVAVANLAQQQMFFRSHMQPWVDEMCEALAAHPGARFYARLAAFARAFFAVETQGFDMLG